MRTSRRSVAWLVWGLAVLAAPAVAGDPTCTPLTVAASEGNPYALQGVVQRVTAGGAGWSYEGCFATGAHFCDGVHLESGLHALAELDFFSPHGFLESSDTLASGLFASVLTSDVWTSQVWFIPGGGGLWHWPEVHAGALVGAPELAPGATWLEIEGLELHEPDQLVVQGVVSGGLDAIVRYTIDAQLDVSQPEALLVTGDLIQGRAVLAVGGSSDLNWSANADGQVLATVLLEVSGGPPVEALVLDGAILAESGAAAALVPGETWAVTADDEVELSAQGDWIFQSALASGRELVVKNGALLALTGEPVPGVAGATLSDVDGARLSDDGQALWSGRWSAGFPESRALFLEDAPLVQSRGGFAPATSVAPGDLLSLIQSDPALWDITDDGRRVAFLGQGQFSGWGVYTAPTGAFADVAGGLAGTGAATPTLWGTGSLEAGEPASLSLDGALPSAATYLVVGFSELSAAFKGGLLVPQPDVLLPGLSTDGSGSWELATTWPAGAPACTPFWMQVWVADPGGPVGFSASNGLRAQTP